VAFAVEDRIDPFGLRLDFLHLGELFERGHARLVGHEVLAVLHHLDAERRAFVRDRRADHELNRLVFEDFALAAYELRFRKPLGERRGEIGLLRVERHQLAAAALDRFALAVDVPVIESNRREPDPRRSRGRRRLRLFLGRQHGPPRYFRPRRGDRGGPQRRPQELAPILPVAVHGSPFT
jgi:hypothetical protein